jgi:hypothetical protein
MVRFFEAGRRRAVLNEAVSNVVKRPLITLTAKAAAGRPLEELFAYCSLQRVEVCRSERTRLSFLEVLPLQKVFRLEQR